MKWRRIKRILFWPESKDEIHNILAKRKTRLEFYKFKEEIREICKQTKLDNVLYENINKHSIEGSVLYFIEKRFLVTGFLIKCDTDKEIYKKLDAFIRFGVGRWIFHFNDDSFFELWQLFKNAPFWKDYAVWKRLNNMLDDF